MLRLLSIEGKGIDLCYNLQRGIRTVESLGEIVVLVVEFCFGCGEHIYGVEFLALFGCFKNRFFTSNEQPR